VGALPLNMTVPANDTSHRLFFYQVGREAMASRLPTRTGGGGALSYLTAAVPERRIRRLYRRDPHDAWDTNPSSYGSIINCAQARRDWTRSTRR